MTDFFGDAGNNTINGSEGDDRIEGREGNDTLNGLGGNDLLIGGPGADILTGGNGADTFRGTAAEMNGDTITDFLIGDRIQITDTNLTVANANLNLKGSDLTFSGGSIHIGNIGPGRLVLRDISGGGFEVRLQSPAHNDFNGDGRSDILWRNDSGIVTDWLANDSFGFNANAANEWQTVPTSWKVVGSADFDGDGRVDLLWRDSSGIVTNWLGNSNGSFTPNANHVWETVPTDWQVVGTADFNGDGRGDILWRNMTSGIVTDWLGASGGGFTPNPANIWSTVPLDWTVAGTGDFNGDGSDDILWRNSASGVLTDWLGDAKGGFKPNAGSLWTNVPDNWKVVGTGDFNGDGLTDLLWRDSASGVVTDWLGTSTGAFTPNAEKFWQTVPLEWSVAATGDYDGNALDDILWRNTNTGVVTDWLAANNTFSANAAHVWETVPASWHVIADPFQ